jgi:predicted GNAT superfamily acetyltransferase
MAMQERAEIECERREGYARLAACATVAEARELYERLPKNQEAAAKWRAILRKAVDAILGRREKT